MRTETKVMLDHEEEAVYYTQKTLEYSASMRRYWRSKGPVGHPSVVKVDATNLAHQGFKALMHNSVALSLPAEELVELARCTEKICKYSWEK